MSHVGPGGSCQLCKGTHFGSGPLCPYRCETCGYNTGACDKQPQPCERNARWEKELKQEWPVKEITMIVAREFLVEVRTFIAGTRQEHRHCDDSWYCCRACRCEDHGLAPGEHLGRGHDNIRGPLHGDGICTCGADTHNTAVVALLKKIDEKIEASR